MCVSVCGVCVSRGMTCEGQRTACSDQFYRILPPCALWGWTQIMSVGSKHLYLLGHLAGPILYFFMAKLNSSVYEYPIFFVHSSVHSYLGWFHFPAIVDSVTIIIDVTSISMVKWSVSQCMSNSGNLGYIIVLVLVSFFFFFFLTSHTDFHSGYSSLHSYQGSSATLSSPELFPLMFLNGVK